MQYILALSPISILISYDIWSHFRIRIKIWDQSVFLPRDDIHGAAYKCYRVVSLRLSVTFVYCIKMKNILKHFIVPDIDIDRTIAILSVRPSVRLSVSQARSGIV